MSEFIPSTTFNASHPVEANAEVYLECVDVINHYDCVLHQMICLDRSSYKCDIIVDACINNVRKVDHMYGEQPVRLGLL